MISLFRLLRALQRYDAGLQGANLVYHSQAGVVGFYPVAIGMPGWDRPASSNQILEDPGSASPLPC